MEMDSSRRSSMDRSRELPGLKKPRLSEDTSDRDRAANGVSSRASSANQQVNPRLRANEKEREEREDSIRGPASSSASSYQQQQELVAQYKTALAELTFNSKPIITNLTIIAGENLHAAKGIAAAICNNVLEVPSEQKLPSLYLLDSIVKNIGRDYIKYFAGRLPEVFCKAYKQVDSSTHPGMRHLFGTWKGVFPPAPLQIIEKELGFPPVNNGSSGTTVSRSDSQTQRPAHSIHVNPKYLQARQRLQQTRAKEINSDDGGDMVTSIEDAERSVRTAITGSARQWTDLSGKMPNSQRPQRELSNDPIYEKKGQRDIKDHQFSSILSRQPDLGAGRLSERTKERDELEKPYYGAGGTASETVISRRNGFDANHSHGDYRASGFAQTDRQLPSVHLNNTNKSIQATSKNWKNSEEEEYMWDDMDSKSTDYGGNNSLTKGVWNIDKADKRASLQRGQWIPLESEQPDLRRGKLDTFPRLKPSVGEDRVPLFRDIDDNHLQPHSQWDADPRRHLETSADLLSVGHVASGHHASTIWPQREPLLPVPGQNQMSSRLSGQSEGGAVSLSSGSSTNSISPLARSGLLSHSHPSSVGPSTNIIQGPGGIFGQKRQQPLQPPSPSAHPSPSFQPLQHKKLHNAIDHDRPQPPFSQMGQKPMQLPGHLNRAPDASVTRDTSPGLAQNQSQQSHSLQNLLQPPSQPSQPSSTLFTHLRHHPPFLHQSQPVLPLQQSQTHSQSLIHSEKPQTSSQSSGTPHSHGFSGDITSTNSIDLPGQSSTSNLLAAIMKSGLLQNNPTSGLQNFNIQPPLPSGPPPIQALTSPAPMVTPSSLSLQTSLGNAPSLTAPVTGGVLPPLPPGPPPPSSLVSTASQKSNTTGAVSNPFSSLLSSLVAKGIISSPATEMPSKVPEQSIEFSSSSSVQVPSTSDKSTVPPSTSDNLTVPPSAKEPSVSETSAPTGVASLAQNATELEDLLGLDFKPEIIRELHPLVISSLFDDLKHQCDICGLRFKLQEQLHSHSYLHTSEKSVLSSDELFRKWYSNTSNWVAGETESPQVPVLTGSLEDVAPTSEKCEPVVPADERQSICALCGEPFEDIYSHERDEWMYKGTVYLNSSERKGDTGSMDETDEQVLIVHARCVSSSADNKDVAENDKMLVLHTNVLSFAPGEKEQTGSGGC